MKIFILLIFTLYGCESSNPDNTITLTGVYNSYHETSGFIECGEIERWWLYGKGLKFQKFEEAYSKLISTPYEYVLVTIKGMKDRETEDARRDYIGTIYFNDSISFSANRKKIESCVSSYKKYTDKINKDPIKWGDKIQNKGVR